MLVPNFRGIWSWLAKWGAVALGFGALFAGDARGNNSVSLSPSSDRGSSKPLGSNVDEVVIRTDGDKVYLSQGASGFEELLLGDTPDATFLRRLLRDAGATQGPLSIPVGSTIVANGGGRSDGARPEQQQKTTASKSKHKQPYKQPPTGQ